MKRVWASSFMAILWVLLVVFVPTSIAQPQGTGVIRGKIQNETMDGTGVADVEVTLHQHGDEQEKQRGSTKTENDGTFSFSGVSLEKEKAYRQRYCHLQIAGKMIVVHKGRRNEIFMCPPQPRQIQKILRKLAFDSGK